MPCFHPHPTRWCVLQTIRSCHERNGWTPTYREIQEELGLALSTIQYHVRSLAEAGFLTVHGKSGIRLNKDVA